jgi:hypothetical protein
MVEGLCSPTLNTPSHSEWCTAHGAHKSFLWGLEKAQVEHRVGLPGRHAQPCRGQRLYSGRESWIVGAQPNLPLLKLGQVRKAASFCPPWESFTLKLPAGDLQGELSRKWRCPPPLSWTQTLCKPSAWESLGAHPPVSAEEY